MIRELAAMRLASVIGVLLLAGGITPAQATTCGKLVDNLSSGNLAESAAAMGYINGVLDMHDTVVAWEKMKPVVCLPEDTSFLDTLELISRWVEDNPDMRENTGEFCVLLPLSRAYPCPDSKGP